MAAGTTLLAEGVIEVEVASDRLGVTLLRATGRVAAPTLPTRPVQAGPPTETPEAQCLGPTTFALGILRGVGRDDLAGAWERFALPILEVPAPGGGQGPASGRLLTIDDAQLSGARLVGDAVEVRIWNDRMTTRTATVGSQAVGLGPARIETVRLEPPG